MRDAAARDAAPRAHEFLYAERPSPAVALVRAAAAPLGWSWGALAALRRTLYRRRILRAARVPVPVVSIGNVTVGGTGKTPLVEWVARRALAAGLVPGIVMRGYGASAGARPRVVRGDELSESDEALLLARRAPEAIVVAGRDRVLGARIAIDAGASALVLDDGFQHLRLARDLDVVLLDARVPIGRGRVLPAGALREPWSALRDANLIVAVDEHGSRLAARAGAPVVRAARRATGVARASGGGEPPGSLRARRVFLLSGIAHPSGFRATAAATGAVIAGEAHFTDHHRFTARDLDEALEASRCAGAEIILTTEKDAMRLPPEFLARAEVAVLQITLEIVEHEALLRDAIDRALGERKR